MPELDMDEKFFNDTRPEWTLRKHKILEFVGTVTAMKFARFGEVVLIDGYAGPNRYGQEIVGSTVSLVNAAKNALQKSKSRDLRIKVVGCEPDSERFKLACESLGADLCGDLVEMFPTSHSEAVAQILNLAAGAPAFVFLDPQSPAQLKLNEDLIPWINRPRTDILGVFMGGAAARVCAAHGYQMGQTVHPEVFMGPNWKEATTFEGAFRVYGNFLRSFPNSKKFAAMYKLVKEARDELAYGIFGLSNSEHGITLLSEAVAKDWDAVIEKKKRATTGNLFERDESIERILKLAGLIERFVGKENLIRNGRKLGCSELQRCLFNSNANVDDFFGRFKSSDYKDAIDMLNGGQGRN